MDLTAAFADPIWRDLAGGNTTVVVRTTPTSFARTDGISVTYVDHARFVQLAQKLRALAPRSLAIAPPTLHKQARKGCAFGPPQQL